MVKDRLLNIGVLNVQGAVSEHGESIRSLGDNPVFVKHPEDLEDVDGLIIPGGESTTIGKLISKYNLFSLLQEKARSGMPIFGTCAGMILLANRIENQEHAHLQLMDIVVNRNSFGRQRESFETPLQVVGVAEDFPAVFIRAPHITEYGANVKALAKLEGRVVAAEQGNLLATAFHPELTHDSRVHRHFREMILNYLNGN